MSDQEKTTLPVWAALHRRDGSELTANTAPGYQRRPYSEIGARWPKAPDDWGWVSYVSAWNAKTGGECVSNPALQPLNPEWADLAMSNDQPKQFQTTLLDRFIAWLDRDIEKMKCESDATWSRTVPGLAGIPRKSLSWWAQKRAIFRAARSGRYE